MDTEKLEMEMLGFGCPSCVYTIEKTGRKIPTITNISVNLANQRIYIEHTGDRAEIVQKISEIINRIGHEVRELPSAVSV